MKKSLLGPLFLLIFFTAGLIFVPQANATFWSDCRGLLATVISVMKHELPDDRQGQELVRLGFRRFEGTGFYQKDGITIEVTEGQPPRFWRNLTGAPAQSIWSLARSSSEASRSKFALKTVGKIGGRSSVEDSDLVGGTRRTGDGTPVHDLHDVTMLQQLQRAGFVQNVSSPQMLTVDDEQGAFVVALLSRNGKLHSLLCPVETRLRSLLDSSTRFLGWRKVPSRNPGLLPDQPALLIETSVVKLEINGSGQVIQGSQTAKIDYASLSDEFLGVKSFPPNMEGTTEFVIGGRNQTDVVQKLTSLNGRPIAELEAIMRPNRASRIGFLGKDDSLLEVLVSDNRFVVDEVDLTHQRIARELKRIHALLRMGLISSGQEFLCHGRKYRLEVEVTKGRQSSPFGDGTRSNLDFKLTNLENGEVIEWGGLLPDLIERYGFYEGPGTSYRLDPRQGLKVLDFVRSENYQSGFTRHVGSSVE